MCARWLAQGVGYVLATAGQAARDRHLTRTQVARCLSIGHPDDVDRHDCISIGPGGGGDSLHQLARVEGSGDFGSVIEIRLDQPDRDRAPGGPVTSSVRVAQGAQQVSDLVVAAKQARALQHSRERVLDEVLRLVARTAKRPRCAIEHVDVIREGHRIERA
jgi:hypothetical protein